MHAGGSVLVGRARLLGILRVHAYDETGWAILQWGREKILRGVLFCIL
ncbi:hypothetical protein PCLA_24f0023 [Pseudomonas citronellolis]|nr:hypothetical protein PCLA_24f0023 [Pseudomonas citronellolis]